MLLILKPATTDFLATWEAAAHVNKQLIQI